MRPASARMASTASRRHSEFNMRGDLATSRQVNAWPSMYRLSISSSSPVARHTCATFRIEGSSQFGA